MKLLFDHNLSRRLVQHLRDIFPEAIHVSMLGLERAPDRIVWSYAQSNGYTIVTKDSDFYDLGFVHGFPPKILWLRLGNCSTQEIAFAMRAKSNLIQEFISDPQTGILELTSF
jgi:predicted nuclease of predicted toxin-antitoxin system